MKFVLLVLLVFAGCADKPRPRRFHVINLSLPKTGSLSLSAIFGRYRAPHDFMLGETVSQLLDWREGKIAERDLLAFLRERDQKGNAEVDSATFFYLAAEKMPAFFPDAKFYLSVRDGAGWIVSMTEMLYNFYGPQKFLKNSGFDEAFMRRYLTAIFPGFSEDTFSDLKTLGEKIRPFLPAMAKRWGEESLKGLTLVKTLPPRKILLVETKNISFSLQQMADFTGVDAATLDGRRTHMHPDFRTLEIRNAIGRVELERVVRPWQVRVDAALQDLKTRR